MAQSATGQVLALQFIIIGDFRLHDVPVDSEAYHLLDLENMVVANGMWRRNARNPRMIAEKARLSSY
jgi:hypothetical protein